MTIKNLNNSSYNLIDLELKYEFHKKRGLISLLVTNLFNKKFKTYIEGLSIFEPKPERRAFLEFEWRF